ncbi:MAG TPA: UDP-N-acetylmuramoyl-L-alanyl-D-glutamate--2,6-diaminopimelate ligase [bacterium]|nr:UDP-N-acetylmuramoyl-L-alanyl-D-glutamate--2,6-diaminopimelate ligase [bacterium]HNS33955.1 UDP-N-acetylmuramoyl-L-alanyl-D-glutamate--2,6-diaminopimelate ligase [bacterium]HNW09359.1 UDP-N-acetylmuramoyl-L-alanyl-D-glutamate--2,6-diaminopimelate ligase [bacterium]HNZ73484.1 UDP-N-acetylmuramoyl-L-alanyl-D-glutamate--2,6-diaminopimelate ligase [bacterium]HOH67480.1 UDP-N-acetylmuramoyl-L-alanyl-D-glutamate--2,6-diaminopimelate ligase [bacterium]
MKSRLKKIIPPGALNRYHQVMAIAANWLYGRPSEKMIVIGVTGTNGKSSTVWLIAKILEAAGYKVGATSTAMFKIADREWLNDQKMTMLGRLALQKILKQMLKAGCQYAVVETSSEGIKQHRHWGINYDVAIFTNLTPEHLEAHGSFDQYKQAKLKLFAKIGRSRKKQLDGRKITKTIIVNGDDQYSQEFLAFPADQKISFGLGNSILDLRAEEIKFTSDGVSFELAGNRFVAPLLGRFNIYNSLAAISAARSQGIDWAVCQRALKATEGIPGRLEFIEEGQNFQVMVDYAPEPESLRQLYQTISDHQLVGPNQKIIQVLGSCGGGRDKSRRPVLGRLAGDRADYVIVTNEDPYDDDPVEIIDAVADGALAVGKTLDKNLFKIWERREAIIKALNLAGAGDLVLLTGKGCEQAICVAGGKKIPWDERQVVREEIRSRLAQKNQINK